MLKNENNNTVLDNNNSFNNINFMELFNPNSDMVLLSCSLNDNKMIFVLRSTKDNKYVILILGKFGSTYLFHENIKIDSLETNLFIPDTIFESVDNTEFKENTGIKFEYIIRDSFDNFVITFIDICEFKFIDNNLDNTSLIDFNKFLSKNTLKYIKICNQIVITGIISDFYDYDCLIYGFRKFDDSNKIVIYGINNSLKFRIELTREMIFLNKKLSLENNEGIFYYHILNINTNIGIIGSFLKIDVTYLNNSDDFIWDKEDSMNISDFDKKNVLKKEEELAWSIIKGMILMEF